MFKNQLHRLAAFAAITTSLHAGNETTAPAPVEPAVKSIFTGDLGVTVANQTTPAALSFKTTASRFSPT